MNKQKRKTQKRKFAALILAGLIMSLGYFALAAPRPVLAQDALSGAQAALEATQGVKPTVGTAVSPGDPTAGAAKAMETTNEKIVKPSIQMVLVSVLLNSFQFMLDRLAYEAAVAIASLGAGETPLIMQKQGTDLWADIGMDIAGEFVGQLSEMTTEAWGLNLCQPPNPLVRMNLAIGIKQAYQPPAPKCDIHQVGQNWQGFVTSTLQFSDNPSQAILKELAKTMQPGNNELSLSLEIMLEAQHRVDLAKATGYQQVLAQDGFKSASDFVTGQVTTPSSVIKKQFEKTTVDDSGKAAAFHMEALLTNPDYLWAMLFNTLSIFTNTLLSESLSRIYTGMFEPSPEINPFNLEALSGGAGAKEAAMKRFAIKTAQPTAIANYNILAEFVACPTSGVAVPNINNCVMDANFAAAVSRAASRNSLTVQEAIDQGLLRGNWPLISPDNATKNENPLCYTQGYCYGNLVKMRKARIIPVGFEIAALRSPVNNPPTLQEVVDGFNNCNPEGVIDEATNPWCHLIDPNWVLKYPETQCRAFVSGEQLVSGYSPGRANVCADLTSCISESNDGSCQGGFGYCVREKNVWRFRGDECPAQFAGCLAFTNTDTADKKNLLVNTVDFGACGQANAGCYWYRANKYLDDKGTADQSDDTFEFLPAGDSYLTAAWDGLYEYQGSTRGNTVFVSGQAVPIYQKYAHEDRIYFDRDAQKCAALDAGCTRLYKISSGLVLNAVKNGGFEIDEDNDGVPDGWSGLQASDLETDPSEVHSGERALHRRGEPDNSFYQNGIELSPNTFYTFSLWAKQGSGTGANAKIRIYDAAGALLPLSGLSSTCAIEKTTIAGTDLYNYRSDPDFTGLGDEYKYFECVFTTPSNTAYANLEIDPSGSVRFDNIQINLGATAADFAQGYNFSGATSYLKLPPDYLNCRGLPTDPKECANYTKVCSEQEVGCNLYTPKTGGPAIPAIASEPDACPAACSGYAAFKQEATKYEQAFFPEYFIAATAASCTAAQVGCDSFTNLDTVAQGGEGVEHYTDLRACQRPEAAGANAQSYFTWEGSDQTGFQLRSWQLLKSDLNQAPCVNWQMNSASTLICTDAAGSVTPEICDGREDLTANPDCREFYDEAGAIHYREYSRTVTMSAQCHPYRKTISVRADCETSGGFYTAAGECRYLGLSAESQSCPAAAAGCRAYTGGAGRNLSYVLDENFERGTYENFMATSGATLAISNESLAPGGRSLRVGAGANQGIATLQAKLASECTNEAGCTAAADSAFPGVSCLVPMGGDNCGAMVSSLAENKTFRVEFWAKGSGPVNVYFEENGGAGGKHLLGRVELSGSWNLYALGPWDSSEHGGFDQNAILSFKAESAGTTFYLDNLQVLQAEENINLIKYSWVTPGVCDQTPTGLAAPQYYLGCREYADSNNATRYFYQFSRLCGEDKVGCGAYYHTANSASPYGQVYNARCINGAAPNGITAAAPTACQYEGKTVCTVQPGKNFCLFNLNQTLAKPWPGNIALGPEAKIVPGDKPVFLIDKGNTSCSAANAGCTEAGKPVYNRDKSAVESFGSEYFLNNPDEYSNALCAHEALFCAEWTSTKDGNFYFKDPLGQTCVYKTGVAIGGREFFGWFRQGTNEPCYFDDANGNGVFDFAAEQAVIKEGGKFEIWRNGDPQYAGWAGQCEAAQDLCAEFLDPTDTQEGRQVLGKPYYFKNNDALSEKKLAAPERCDGQVSQKQGCALFNNTSLSRLTYAAEPSYIASVRADDLFGRAKFSKVNPIDCNAYTGSENNLNINLCASRCAYNTGGTPLESQLSVISPNDPKKLYTGACVDDSDCSAQVARNGLTYNGSCEREVDSAVRFANDTNTIIKVIRDRECAQWLTCRSKNITFDKNQQKWVEICEDLQLCSRYTREGDTTECTAADLAEPYVLNANYYSARDVSWRGYEYSGYSIPNQLPVDLYDQVDLNPAKQCVFRGVIDRDEITGLPKPCVTESDCGAGIGRSCVRPEQPNYVLAHAAGPCDTPYNTACSVGFCQDHPRIACGRSEDCPNSQEICAIGYCQDLQAGTGSTDTPCAGNADCAGLTCVPSALSKRGTCFNNQCLVDIYGQPFNAAQKIYAECRGYPEIDSPFTSEAGVVAVVYKTSNDPAFVPKPTQFKTNYAQANLCSPVKAGDGWEYTRDCLCSYDKISYSGGIMTRYYPPETEFDALRGLCQGGKYDGYECDNDYQCGCAREGEENCRSNEVSVGICAKPSQKEHFEGWDGYCIERDSATHIYADSAKNACLTWLPADRISGATDLYGKEVDAGQYINQDIFYCSETGYYMDLYPTGTVFDPSGAIIGIDYACASAIDEVGMVNCDVGERKSCEQNVYCPKGWVALVGMCGGAKQNETSLGYCEIKLDQNSDTMKKMPLQAVDPYFPETINDCPYFCVPEKSLHSEGSDAGSSCFGSGQIPDQPDGTSRFDTPYHIRFDLGIAGYPASEVELFTQSNKAFKKYSDCVVRGVPVGTEDYNTDWYHDFGEISTGDIINGFYKGYGWKRNTNIDSRQKSIDSGFGHTAYGILHRAVGASYQHCELTGEICDQVSDCRTELGSEFGTFSVISLISLFADLVSQLTGRCSAFGGPDTLSGSIRPYYGCYEITQVSSANQAESNKAWTNRLWQASQYETADPGTVWGAAALTYKVADQPAAAGRALLAEYFQPDPNRETYKIKSSFHDAFPLPVLTQKGNYVMGTIGLDTAISPSTLRDNKIYKYPTARQYITTGGASILINNLGGAAHSLAYSYETVTNLSGERKAVIDGLTEENYGEFGNSRSLADPEAQKSLRLMISQLFAKAYAIYRYNWQEDKGVYKKVTEPPNRKYLDISSVGDTFGTGFNAFARGGEQVPKVVSVGACDKGKCVEGIEGTMSANGFANQNVIFNGGVGQVTLNFFAYAAPNQMPIRQIRVDWGDGQDNGDPANWTNWPLDSQTGSSATNNYYKNRRGTKTYGGESWCNTADMGFGGTPEACDTSYITFVHRYTCSQDLMGDLQAAGRTCQFTDLPNGDRRLLQSPCYDDSTRGGCGFQPRVHVKDNWGWCTGTCEYSDVDQTPQCYGEECDPSNCPGPLCLDNGGINGIPQIDPWVYYEGYIVVTP